MTRPIKIILSIASLTCFVIPGKTLAAKPLGTTEPRYHSSSEIADHIRATTAMAPDFIRSQTIGISAEGRKIDVISFGLRPNQPLNAKPSIFINATHHGDEKISTEVALDLMTTLARQLTGDDVAAVLDRFAIHIQPLVNPDGHARGTRNNANNVDINRDYDFPGRAVSKAFKTDEAIIVRDFLKQINIRGALALHAGSSGVLWPWCFTSESPPDGPFLSRLAWKTAGPLMTEARQSYEDYPSEGEFSDFVYWRYGAPALTLEVDDHHQPPPGRIRAVTARSRKAILSYISELMRSDDLALNKLKLPYIGAPDLR